MSAEVCRGYCKLRDLKRPPVSHCPYKLPNLDENTGVAKISVTCDKCHQDAWGEAKTYGKPIQK